ncbi:unnamed protein product [Gadus morhua 'NCC']
MILMVTPGRGTRQQTEYTPGGSPGELYRSHEENVRWPPPLMERGPGSLPRPLSWHQPLWANGAIQSAASTGVAAARAVIGYRSEQRERDEDSPQCEPSPARRAALQVSPRYLLLSAMEKTASATSELDPNLRAHLRHDLRSKAGTGWCDRGDPPWTTLPPGRDRSYSTVCRPLGDSVAGGWRGEAEENRGVTWISETRTAAIEIVWEIRRAL